MNNKILMISILLFSLIMSTGCINNNNDTNEENISIKYELVITSDNNSDFILYVPAIIENDGVYSSINNDIKVIGGDCEFQSIDTLHGKAIKIISNNDFKFGFEFERSLDKDDYYDGYPIYFLSMDVDKDGNGDFTEWGNTYIGNRFYLNSSNNLNITVKLIFTVATTHSGGGFELNGFLNQNGWKIIEGENSYTMD